VWDHLVSEGARGDIGGRNGRKPGESLRKRTALAKKSGKELKKKTKG